MTTPTLANVAAQLETAREAAEPYEKEFWDRHQDCADLWERRRKGEHIPKDVMLAAYDRRMEAGQHRHPGAVRVKHIEDWLKSLQRDLDAKLPKKKRATMRQHALSLTGR